MKKENIKKISLNKKEREYLSGLIEHHCSKIDFLPKKQKEKNPIKNDLKIANRLKEKLSLD